MISNKPDEYFRLNFGSSWDFLWGYGAADRLSISVRGPWSRYGFFGGTRQVLLKGKCQDKGFLSLVGLFLLL